MRLKVVFILSFIFFGVSIHAQTKQVTLPKPPAKDTALIDKRINEDFVRTNRNLYSLGIELNDLTLKKTALANLLAHDGADTLSLFRLLELYFNNKEYLPCFGLSKKHLTDKRDNIVLLDYFSKSAELLNRYGDAIVGYKKLYFLTDDIFYGYLGSNAEFMLGRYLECRTSTEEVLNQCLKQPDNHEMVTFVEKDGRQQNVSIKAALYNLLGLNFMELQDKQKAKAAFTAAVQEFPDFIEGKNNLSASSH